MSGKGSKAGSRPPSRPVKPPAKPRAQSPTRPVAQPPAKRAVPAALAGAVLLAILLWTGLRLRPGGALAADPGRAAASAATVPAAGVAAPPPAVRLRVDVLASHPHDPRAFTQGLLWHAGALYESTGLQGSSSLRRVDLATGRVLAKVDLEPELFGEGLALADGHLEQLTWTSGRALLYDLSSFERVGERTYPGEGWGLTFDGRRLVMSDGSDRLTFRDPETFAATGSLTVVLDGRPVVRLNELEYAEGSVYANVWQTDEIVRIDPVSGRVTALIDAADLLTPEERSHADVLNGIAFDPERRVFLVTGKLWPKLFEVAFVPPA